MQLPPTLEPSFSSARRAVSVACSRDSMPLFAVAGGAGEESNPSNSPSDRIAAFTDCAKGSAIV